MPNFYDFGKLHSIKTIEVDAEGWISPLSIEYGITDDDMPCCCWRVRGTRHTFVIPVGRLDYLSEGDYGAHFKKALEGFRKEYIDWKSEDAITDWMRGYFDEYSRFIIV